MARNENTYKMEHEIFLFEQQTGHGTAETFPRPISADCKHALYMETSCAAAQRACQVGDPVFGWFVCFAAIIRLARSSCWVCQGLRRMIRMPWHSSIHRARLVTDLSQTCHFQSSSPCKPLPDHPQRQSPAMHATVMNAFYHQLRQASLACQ